MTNRLAAWKVSIDIKVASDLGEGYLFCDTYLDLSLIRVCILLFSTQPWTNIPY